MQPNGGTTTISGGGVPTPASGPPSAHASLGHRLLQIVSPNYPLLGGTAIRVTDIEEGAADGGGAQEQDPLASEVRAVLETIWGLEAEDLMRKQYVAAGTSLHDGREGQPGSLPALECRLPPELIRRTLELKFQMNFVVLYQGRTDPLARLNAAFKDFQALRATSRLLKWEAEATDALSLSRLASAVARHFLRGGLDTLDDFQAYRPHGTALRDSARLQLSKIDGASSLNAVLGLCRRLEALSFEAEGIFSVRGTFPSSSTLRSLDITLNSPAWPFNGTTEIAGHTLLDTLKINGSLDNGVPFPDEYGITERTRVPTAASVWPRGLTSLSLTELDLRASFLPSIFGLLAAGLTDLDLSNNKLRTKRGRTPTPWPSHRLRRLVIRESGLETRDVEAMGLQENNSLLTVDLVGNRITHLSIGARETLRGLNLSENHLVRLPGFTMRDHMVLNLLKLDRNPIGDAAIAGLEIGQAQRLLLLDLSETQLTDAAALHLGTASVDTLSLNGCLDLANVNFQLDANNRLRRLELEDCPSISSVDNMHSLSQQLSRNSTLQELNLSRCDLNDTVVSELQLYGSAIRRLTITHNRFTIVGLRAMRFGRLSPTLKVELAGIALNEEELRSLNEREPTVQPEREGEAGQAQGAGWQAEAGAAQQPNP